MLKRKLVLIAAALIVCITVATLLFTTKTSSFTPPPNSPLDLADIVEFPSWYSSQTCSVSLTDPPVNVGVIAGFALHVNGESDIMNELTAEGADMTTVPLFGSTSDQCVNFTGLINAVSFAGSAIGWWTNSFPGPYGLSSNQRALFVMAYDTTSGTSMIISAVTNLNPPNQVVPGYSIVNGMPYVYINFTCWAYGFPGGASSREVSSYYWQYGSDHNPNWFWGFYSQWRNYLASYGLTYNAWFWWFWHWSYSEFWYYWGPGFPYD
jgi:hypothetical protein